MPGSASNDETPAANASDGNKEEEAVEERHGTRPVPAGRARAAEDTEEGVVGKEKQHADGEASTHFAVRGSENRQEGEPARVVEDIEEGVDGKEEQHADEEAGTPVASPGSEVTQKTES